jgi:hypothetical protein
VSEESTYDTTEETDAPAEKQGCKSIVYAALLMALPAAALCMKRKRD